jgi:hypothetical protein
VPKHGIKKECQGNRKSMECHASTTKWFPMSKDMLKGIEAEPRQRVNAEPANRPARTSPRPSPNRARPGMAWPHAQTARGRVGFGPAQTPPTQNTQVDIVVRVVRVDNQRPWDRGRIFELSKFENGGEGI